MEQLRRTPGKLHGPRRCCAATLAAIFAFIPEDRGLIGSLLAGKISGEWKSRQTNLVVFFFFFFLKPIQLLSLSVFHRFPPVLLPFFLSQPCLPLTETLVGNKKQAALEKMKVGRDRT